MCALSICADRFKGRNVDRHGVDQGVSMHMYDTRLRQTDQQMRERHKRVAAAPDSARAEGCTGACCVHEMLDYVSPNNLYVLPVAHSLLYGVVQAFVSHILRPVKFARKGVADIVSLASRKLMREMAAYILVTSDFGRKYKCIEKYRCDMAWRGL